MQPLEIDSAVFCDGAHYTIISRSLTDPGTQARGAKRAAGSRARDGAAGRGPAL